MERKEILEKIMALKAKKDKVGVMIDDMIKMYSTKLSAEMTEAEQHTLYGDTGIAFFRPQNSVEVLDWAEVHKFILKKGAWELLVSKVSAPALQKRLDAGDKIPGVSIKSKKVFVIQKLKGNKGESSDEEGDNEE